MREPKVSFLPSENAGNKLSQICPKLSMKQKVDNDRINFSFIFKLRSLYALFL